MTPEERSKQEAWLRSFPEYDGPISAGGHYALMKNCPPPDTAGMTPGEKEAAMEKWLIEVEKTRIAMRDAHWKNAAEPAVEMSPIPAPVPAA